MLMNKDFFFEGKEYISASQASKKLGYAQDYVGELARSKKVAGKLIGRTWYVELDSLLEHKKNRKAKNRKGAQNAPVGIFTKASSQKPQKALIYKTEISRKLPELKKAKKFSSWYERFVMSLVSVSISLIIIANVAAAWVAYLSPSVATNADIKIATVSDSALNSMTASAISAQGFTNFILSGIENKIASLFGKNTQSVSAETTSSTGANGIVVVPTNARHADDVSKIQNDFSDPVDVTFDQDGKSGVITPEFRDGNATSTYTFVAVPVTKNK